VTDIDHFIRMALVTNPLRAPVFRAAIQALQLPPASRGLDVGCGIGLQALMLAEAVAPAGHVTGVDSCPEFLNYAREMANKAGLSNRITFRQGDANKLPVADHTFDWAWSSDCVGYSPMEPLPLVKELARVVKPGGTVAVLAWSSQNLLPGHPLLEARLEATPSGIAPFVAGNKPESHFLRALGWFRDAGLQAPTARTFAGSAHAPLTDDLRAALIALFEMRWPGVESEVTGDDWAQYQRLCRPDSQEFVVDRPDYYAFFTYSMFQGTAPQTHASALTCARERVE
jgi:ubiquinone/menaquinone biosynthesis C-methylase UbiE